MVTLIRNGVCPRKQTHNKVFVLDQTEIFMKGFFCFLAKIHFRSTYTDRKSVSSTFGVYFLVLKMRQFQIQFAWL